jgi:hypothetical protein
MKRVLFVVVLLFGIARGGFAQELSVTPPSAVQITAPTAVDLAPTATLFMNARAVGDTSVQTPLVFPLGTSLRATWPAVPDEVATSLTMYRFRLDGTVTDITNVRQANYSHVIPQNLLAAGAHTAGLSACNTLISSGQTQCTQESTVEFVVDRPLPARPTLSISPVTPDMALNRRQGEELVQNYAGVALMRRLNGGEMNEVERRFTNMFGGAGITRERIFQVMDPWFLEHAR